MAKFQVNHPFYSHHNTGCVQEKRILAFTLIVACEFLAERITWSVSTPKFGCVIIATTGKEKKKRIGGISDRLAKAEQIFYYQQLCLIPSTNIFNN